ncbi:protein MODIFYING WALL LIGNIN-1-like [Diospyros lotus]|uniref:protein MODIFYING WALL LIGNIN-1-like n=1 Tax=Diospyros lotus TaxID=55363 RepID=UPI002251B7E9|nr:protein MODIFYING WALL LIGNIN-1-like [Diospyros lotus]
MEKKAIVVCSVVGFLGLLSAVTGFAAEATRIKGSQVQFTGPTCVYPSSPALGLGLTAAVALMVAQIIINVTTGCMCCKKGAHQSNSNWTVALVCFVVSWFTFVIAFLLLLTGAALNDQHGEETMYFGNYYCYVVKPGVFAGAAVLSLASVILGIVYYLALSSEKNSDPLWRGPPPPPDQSSIAMGQPCPPPNAHAHAQAQAPVFVHEDTYMRRQFT